MIDVIFAGMVYTATLMNCYDGDTCKIRFDNAPPFLAEQTLRFEDFDTPEIKGKCKSEKQLARKARTVTRAYMKNAPRLETSGERGKYGRLLVRADGLKTSLIEQGLARVWRGKRESWCP